MRSVFNKNVFLPNEIAAGSVHVNNEHCQLDAHRVSFYVEQVLYIKCGLKSHTYKTKLIENTVVGPQAGIADWSTELLLDLSKIRYEVASHKKKKGV